MKASTVLFLFPFDNLSGLPREGSFTPSLLSGFSKFSAIPILWQESKEFGLKLSAWFGSFSFFKIGKTTGFLQSSRTLQFYPCELKLKPWKDRPLRVMGHSLCDFELKPPRFWSIFLFFLYKFWLSNGSWPRMFSNISAPAFMYLNYSRCLYLPIVKSNLLKTDLLYLFFLFK